MGKYYLLILTVLYSIAAVAQTNVNYTISVQQERHSISPFIYGINNGVYKKATWRRWGGNRTSAYNWENNYSNAGADWYHQNDDYIPWSMGLPASQYLVPASPLFAFHDSSLAQNAFSAITLPMVGYVARDGGGQVAVTELAPSARWRQVVNVKGSAFSLTPDTTDNNIYVDEEINRLITQFGMANTTNGIKAYIMDNEPGLWCTQFAHMRDQTNNCVTYNELLTKSVALSTTIKNMDSSAMVFGPESYGFNEYWGLQNATDAGNYSSDHWFVDSYLKHMEQASNTAGKRLLDVFSVHWYPDTYTGNVYSADTSQTVCLERMQCTRTLWDSSYTSNSWIGQWYGGELPIIPRLRSSIAQFYPGTKFCIDEYAWGANDHISGGIAQADALGAFGKRMVDYAAAWIEPTGYIRSAFDLYRDYDGNNGQFGAISVKSTSNNIPASTVWASVADSTNMELHIIVNNKSYTSTVNGTFNLQGNVNYNKAEDYYFTASDSNIAYTLLPANAIVSNSFTYSLPPLSVHHFVIRDTNTLSAKNLTARDELKLSVGPNPSNGKVRINYSTEFETSEGTIYITDITGRNIRTYHQRSGKGSITADLQPGIYFIRYLVANQTLTEKLIIR